MSRLISLYPGPWRERYESELRDLLAARPPNLAGRLDLVAGALDAWLHPELIVPGAADRRPSTRVRLAGLAAVAGGALWLAMTTTLVVVASTGRDADFTVAGWVVVLLMTVAALGATPAGRARGVGALILLAGLLFGLGVVLPWELKPLPVVPLLLVVFGGLLTIATVRTGLSRSAQRTIVGIGFGLPFPVVIAGLAGLLPYLPSTPAVLLSLVWVYGVAWLIVGGVLILGGGNRLPAPPSPTARTEVAA
ncbi:MAG TPA: hypothetical protein VFV53_06760 [Candidatus Limnocylindrales bacterium]|nr:hypothetical protein [Candidatus Limnocylindrales bacterium]